MTKRVWIWIIILVVFYIIYDTWKNTKVKTPQQGEVYYSYPGNPGVTLNDELFWFGPLPESMQMSDNVDNPFRGGGSGADIYGNDIFDYMYMPFDFGEMP